MLKKLAQASHRYGLPVIADVSSLKKMAYTDKFGFLNIKSSLLFEGGSVDVMDDFDLIRKYVEDNTHKDGFLYPPQIKSMRVDPSTMEDIEEIPKTRRPALTYKLPSSHKISLHMKGDENDIRTKDAGLVIHLLAYLFGTRLQFSDWWHDGRIPIKSTHNVDLSVITAENFISKSLVNWRQWNECHKQWMLNILIMHSRAASYEWDWERFTIEYMVLDGIYKLVSEQFGLKGRPPHKQRLKILLDQFEMEYDDDKVNEIYELRNDLFHQSLWGKGLPCTHKASAFYGQLNLSKINNRLIPAALGYETKYIRSSWLSLAHQYFYSENES